ncbi:hypothetical protein N8577_04170 [Akkermansiaceae bacterium]|nr:hypothetical protein [Akkermansiaceae bacterium]MDA7678425.1 hypothetical protein [Akkermansiaceae bacterium]MDB4440632.1 hypothetical protein [Akkermansiaceae bacterium]
MILESNIHTLLFKKINIAMESSTNQQNPNVIELEGASTPDIVLNNDEQFLLNFSQGVRDLGIIGKVLSHTGRLITTNQRIIYFKKKTKDFEIQQMNIGHAGYVSLGYQLRFVSLLIAAFIFLVGLVAIAYAGEIFLGLLLIVIGGIILLFARTRSLVISGSGEKIVFDSKSITSSELAQVILAISANS